MQKIQLKRGLDTTFDGAWGSGVVRKNTNLLSS